jgi:hypothetical protein
MMASSYSQLRLLYARTGSIRRSSRAGSLLGYHLGKLGKKNHEFMEFAVGLCTRRSPRDMSEWKMIAPAPTALPPMAREIFYALFHDIKAVIEYLARSYPALMNVKIIGPNPPGSFPRFAESRQQTQFGGSTPLLLAAALENWDTGESS